MTDLSLKIQIFITLHSQRLDSISTLKSAKSEVHDDIFKKVLYVALLDTLSKTIYPTRNTRERIVLLLQNFCDWQEADKISLPHLLRLMEMAPDPAFERLRTFAFSEMESWKQGKIIPLTQDPSSKVIRKYWPVEKELRLPVEGVGMESLKHAHLFYAYRNSLVHELRHPGYPLDVRKVGNPYYIGRAPESTNAPELSDTTFSQWELVYPVGFFRDLCSNALKSLNDYYSRNRIDPLSFFDYASYWLTELN